MRGGRERLVKAQPRRKQRIVAVRDWRTPVVCNRRVKALCFFLVHPPESLACHPVQKVIAGSRGSASWHRELSRIVGGAKLIEAGVTFSSFNIVEGPYG